MAFILKRKPRKEPTQPALCPKLMFNETTGKLVLMLSEHGGQGKGVCLAGNDSQPHYYEAWDMSAFQDYTGKASIKNESIPELAPLTI